MTALRVAATEFRQLARSGALALVAVLVAVLLGGSAIVAWRAERAYETQRQRYQATVEAQWDAQPARHPHRVSHYGYLLFRPRPPLGFFDDGVTPQTGSTVFLEAHRQNSMNFADASQADAPLGFGTLSMALVLQLVVPLVVFVAAAGTVARDRQDGTLALLLAQGARWSSVLAGKTLAVFVTAVMLALPAVVVTGALLAWRGDTGGSGDIGTRATALLGAHVGYFAICAAIGVAVSALCRTSRDATLVLVGLWLALWVVVPRLAPAVGASARDLPTRAEFEADVERRTRALGDSHNPNDEKFAAFKADYLARHGASRIEDLPVNYNGIVMVEGERLTTDAYRGARAVVQAALDRHAAVVAAAGVVSPYVAIRLASMALAGSGVAAADDFEGQAEAYRYALVQHLNGLHAEHVSLAADRYETTGGGSDAPTRQRLAAEHWDEAPAFTYRAPALSVSLAEAAAGLLVLAAWLGALVVGLRRLSPRVV